MTIETQETSSGRSLFARAPRGTSGSREQKKRDFVPYLYVLPALVAYSLFILVPWAQSIWTSFWHWDGIGAATWAGLENYVAVFSNDDLSIALRNGLGFIIFYSVIPVVLGALLAAVIAARPRRGTGLVRTVLFLPQILPLVAVGVIWRYLYSADGPINQTLSAIGLGGAARAWLGDFVWAYPAVGAVGTWVSTGLCVLLLLSGIQKIDPSLYEAAKLDRCGPVGLFMHVTLPGIRKEVVVALTVTLIAALASFDIVYVTTGGGPGLQTIVPGVLIYRLVFTSNEVGLACALATVLSAIILVFVALIGRLGREQT
ncbi:raffinose/stachyose/melibiose transport system permease protein [Zhihengliuella halotolerans]|uniref:Raffinose/stachyose/melibiose transport system permease protein n=1 Tax=Zhihengliuella halotolerans TaxID=370736 RepID=A0A4Q8AFM2_9MICC|nr:raffinose/stachyose/melibiose transport system permease protein [Zhihengliuella halotolerans]